MIRRTLADLLNLTLDEQQLTIDSPMHSHETRHSTENPADVGARATLETLYKELKKIVASDLHDKLADILDTMTQGLARSGSSTEQGIARTAREYRKRCESERAPRTVHEALECMNRVVSSQ